MSKSPDTKREPRLSEAIMSKCPDTKREPIVYLRIGVNAKELAGGHEDPLLGWHYGNYPDIHALCGQKQHRDWTELPIGAAALCEKLGGLLSGLHIGPLGSESDCELKPFVIKGDGLDDTVEAIFQAFDFARVTQPCATIEDCDLNKPFTYAHEDLDCLEDGLAAAWRLLWKACSEVFLFTFTESLVLAPVMFVGRLDKETIVGMLGERVWT